ncbi:MAG: HisA/HisF-related TIM barrel protein [Lawsonella clevelandensis]
MVDVVRATAEEVFIPLTVGGGIRAVEDIDRMLRAGADKVSINTAAIANPQLLTDGARTFGPSASCCRSMRALSRQGRNPLPQVGRSPPMAVPAVLVLMPSSGRAAAKNWGWGDPPEFHGCGRD